jgi:hypothetical protein
MQQAKVEKTHPLQRFHELIGPEKFKAVVSALIAKGMDVRNIPTLNRFCAALEGDADALATPAAKALLEVLAVIERRPRGAAATKGSGSKSVADFERELQTIPISDRVDWLRKNVAAIKNAYVTDLHPNAVLMKKKGSR